MRIRHRERHRTERIGWLQATVRGGNDGIVSTASLLLGVSTANAIYSDVLIAGFAGLVAGAMSMAAGEYVSVQSQADTEEAATLRLSERSSYRTLQVSTRNSAFPSISGRVLFKRHLPQPAASLLEPLRLF